MAATNPTDSRRFVFRASDKSSEPYYIPINRSGSNVSKSSTLLPEQARPHIIRSADVITPRTEVETPARRIVVIRNTKHHPVDQGHVDLGDFGKPNSIDTPPVISDGHKSVFLIRRPIAPTELTKSIESDQPVEKLSPTTSLEHIRTPSPLQQIVSSPEQPRSPSPIRSPPIRPKSSKQPISSARTEYSQRHASYLRRPKSKPRTPSPVPVSTIRRSPSPSNRPRSKPVKHHSPTPLPKQEEPKETGVKRGFFSFFSKKNTTEQTSAPPPVIIENDQHTIQNRPMSRGKSAQRKKSANSSAKSTKSVVFVNPDDQSIAVIENSNVKGESLRPIVKRPKSFKKTRFQDEAGNESTETLVKTYRRQRCLSCLSRHMCLIIIICFILVLIGLAGVGVSAYFLATNSSNNLIPKIVGIAVGGVLAIAALCFLYILLACIGSRDGYFTYNDDDGPHIGGRAFALISPSHPNAHLYILRDYMKMVENSYPPPPPPPSASLSNLTFSHPQLMQPITTAPYTPHQQTVHKSNISTNNYETKSNKNNITIEMPERLLTGREMSPRSRERSLTKVVKNIGHVVEDAKKRYNGDVPNKVIVKVDKNATPIT